MHYGIVLPILGGCGDARTLGELAQEAEEASWDGVFLWDSLLSVTWDSFFRDDPEMRATCDPWIALAAIAIRTEQIRMGTMITPLSRRRPWKVARESVTVDHLSSGRLVLPVGLGDVEDGGFSKVGEETDRKVRAQRLDEAVEILSGLWSGQPFSFRGKHYRVNQMTFLPRPVQSPRIPIWVVAAWPRKKSMRRALRWDGIVPVKMNENGSPGVMTPDDIAAMKAYIDEQRSGGGPFDIVVEGYVAGDDRERREAVRPYAEAGATWWLEGVWISLYRRRKGGLDEIRARIRQGPPRVE